MIAAAEAEQFEAAARLRDQLSTVHQLQEKQRIATAEQNDDADVFGYHFEAGSLAVNLFHVRAGKIVDRREFFWDDLPDLLEPSDADNIPDAPGPDSPDQESLGPPVPTLRPGMLQNRPCGAGRTPHLQIPNSTEGLNGAQKTGAPGLDSETWDATKLEGKFRAGPIFSALLKQLYIDQHYVPRTILVPADFDDRETLATLLTERTGHRIEIAVPQRGEKSSLVDLAGQNAKQSYIQRFRVLEPSRKAIQEALADTLMLPELPAASSASTSRTSRARKPSPRWSSGKTAR